MTAIAVVVVVVVVVLVAKAHAKMKITKRQLRRIVREELRRSELIQEGWFTAGMKGILRAVPVVGDIGADAWTESNISGIAEQMDKKFQEFEKRLEALETKQGK